MWNVWWAALITLVVCSVILVMVLWWKTGPTHQGGEEEPLSWKRVGTLGALYLYPVKSARPHVLKEAFATTMGLMEIPQEGCLPMRDRIFVIYKNETGEMVSAKKLTGLVHLGARSIGSDIIELTYPGYEALNFKFPSINETHPLTTIKMWEETLPAVDCGDEVAQWLCRVINKADGGKQSGLRMGCWSNTFTSRRDVSVTKYPKLYNKLRNEDTGAYSDLSSYLMINQTSVDDLKSRLDTSVDISVSALNFRPNLVVEGATLSPYAEDQWDWIKIGDSVIFRNFKPCTRCSVTTIDPETGIRDSHQEPLKTLKKYRQLKDPVLREAEHNSPVMGIYVGVYQEGKIKVGDPIFVG